MRILAASIGILISNSFAWAIAVKSPCVQRFYKETCLADLAASPRSSRVPILEVPSALVKHTLKISRMAVIEQTAHNGGRLLVVHAMSPKALEELRRKSTQYLGEQTSCVWLNKEQAEQFDRGARKIGSANLNVETIETTRKTGIPRIDEIKRGTVLKINRRRFLVLEKIWIHDDYPRLFMDEVPGDAEIGRETTGHRFTFDLDGKFFYEGKETIFQLTREGEVEFTSDGAKSRIGQWIAQSKNEKALTIGKMTYSDFK